MSWKSRMVERSRELVRGPAVMRWVSSDRVMRTAEGVLDAKARIRLALDVLRRGTALPAVDPALDPSLGETVGPNGLDSKDSPDVSSNGHTPASVWREVHTTEALGTTSGSTSRAEALRVLRGGAPAAMPSSGPATSAAGDALRAAPIARSSTNGVAPSNGHPGGGNGQATVASNGHAVVGSNGHGAVATARALRVAPAVNAPTLSPALNPDRSPVAAPAGIEADLRERANLSELGGSDVFQKCYRFTTAETARKAGLYPFFRPLDLNDGPEAVLEGRRVLMFGSNNYLGLTTHPAVRRAAQDAIERFGTSMTGSRLVNGSMKLHNELEERLADFFGKESALVFTTGYQANVATLAALLSNKETVAVIDRNVHASLYDGVRLGQSAGARLVRYRHSDPRALDRALGRLSAGEGAMVITDGVFSAEGEIAKLDELVPIVKKHGARLLVDDAHALGVIGPGGRGTAHHFGLENEVDLITGTFSKAMASVGGWIVGERKVLDYIKHFAPSFMFAASAAPPNVAAAMAAFDLLRGPEASRMEKLRENFTFMRDELTRLGFELGHTQTAVIPIYVRQDLRTLMMWRELLEVHGVYTNPFISPGVPPKSAMLRTSYMATHTREQLERGLEAFEKVGKKYGVI